MTAQILGGIGAIVVGVYFLFFINQQKLEDSYSKYKGMKLTSTGKKLYAWMFRIAFGGVLVWLGIWLVISFFSPLPQKDAQAVKPDPKIVQRDEMLEKTCCGMVQKYHRVYTSNAGKSALENLIGKDSIDLFWVDCGIRPAIEDTCAGLLKDGSYPPVKLPTDLGKLLEVRGYKTDNEEEALAVARAYLAFDSHQSTISAEKYIPGYSDNKKKLPKKLAGEIREPTAKKKADGTYEVVVFTHSNLGGTFTKWRFKIGPKYEVDANAETRISGIGATDYLR